MSGRAEKTNPIFYYSLKYESNFKNNGSAAGGTPLLEHQQGRNCFHLFLYQVILLTSALIKLSVSGKADVEYSACTELTDFASMECLKAYEMQALRCPPLAGAG